MITHVIFDLDGVLLDTEGYNVEAVCAVASAHGLKYVDLRKLRGASGGGYARFLYEALDGSSRSRDPVTVGGLETEFKATLQRILRDATIMAIPGARRLVLGFASMGLTVALATNATEPFYQLKTRDHKWFDAFDTVVLGDDPAVGKPKPAPDIFMLAAVRMKALPEDCLVFEDSAVGVHAAQAAGMQVVKVGS